MSFLSAFRGIAARKKSPELNPSANDAKQLSDSNVDGLIEQINTKNIKTVHFANNHFSVIGVSKLLANCNGQLEHVDLRNNRIVGLGASNSLITAIQASPFLVKLRLDGNSFTSAERAELAKVAEETGIKIELGAPSVAPSAEKFLKKNGVHYAQFLAVPSKDAAKPIGVHKSAAPALDSEPDEKVLSRSFG